MGKKEVIEIDGKRFTVSNLDKVLWPDDGLTKGNLIEYYLRVSSILLPHLMSRPLVLTRYPNGIYGKWFYQKNCPAHSVKWFKTVEIPASTGSIRYMLAESRADLAYLGNLGAIEIHPWLSRDETPDNPDLVVFDLDPAPPATFEDCRVVAFAVREFLREFGLIGFPKTSGATGLHIYVPVDPRYTYEQTRDFVFFGGNMILRAAPDRVTLERTVALRAGKVYIDYLQNVKGKTIVAPYCPRPLPGALVSTPVTWEELETIDPADFTLLTVPERLAEHGDPFGQMHTLKQSLDHALKVMIELRRRAPRLARHLCGEDGGCFTWEK